MSCLQMEFIFWEGLKKNASAVDGYYDVIDLLRQSFKQTDLYISSTTFDSWKGYSANRAPLSVSYIDLKANVYSTSPSDDPLFSAPQPIYEIFAEIDGSDAFEIDSLLNTRNGNLDNKFNIFTENQPSDFLWGNDTINARDFSGRGTGVKIMGYDKSDTITGSYDGDWLHGNHGKDVIYGLRGDDIIRGGHGPDILYGDEGADWIWGGVGANYVNTGEYDNSSDDVYVPVDSIQNSEFGNPDGANADSLVGLGLEDRIYLHGEGLSIEEVSFSSVIVEGSQGIGIYAAGTLEAIVYGELSLDNVRAMTSAGFF